jgi:hypothetical protein
MGWRRLVGRHLGPDQEAEGFRNVGACLAILAALGALAFGLPAVNAAIPAAQTVATDRPYRLGDGVTVAPPARAQLDVTRSGRGTTLFVRGGVRYQIVVAASAGSLADAAAQVRHKITANRGYQVAGVETPTRTDQGIPGRQGGYTSPGRNGRYAVFLAHGVAVQVTIAGADLDLRAALPELTASVDSIRFP